jgi:SAM-dependent MidA family methyltransferase
MDCRDYKHTALIIQLVGIWLLSQWLKAGQSRKIRLVELGPGRGTFMDDILRVCALVCQA